VSYSLVFCFCFVCGRPPFTWEQTAVTFLGTCVTLSVLISIDSSLVASYGREYGIVLGPFGALMTLLFSLTSAPASQPKNVILGQLLSLFIAYGFGQTSMDSRIKACLSTSVSISLMARLGITHPPAGASAMIFSSGSLSLAQVGIMLLANVIAIILGAWCNNISDKRQYPTSWHIVPFFRYLLEVICLDQSRCSFLAANAISTTEKSSSPSRRDDSSLAPAVNSFTVADEKVILTRGQLGCDPNSRHSTGDAKYRRRYSFFSVIPNVFKKSISLSKSLQQQSECQDHVKTFVTDEPRVELDESEEAIDLTAVLAQARNPLFVMDQDTSLTIHPIPARRTTQRRTEVESYVAVEDQSGGNNSIKLSEIIATAARDSNRPIFFAPNDGTNQSFVRLTGFRRYDDGSRDASDKRADMSIGKSGHDDEESIDLFKASVTTMTGNDNVSSRHDLPDDDSSVVDA
jgi:hypothetical protein